MRLMGSQNSWVKKNTTAAGRPPAAEDRVGQSCPVLANPRLKQLKSMLRLSHAQRARESTCDLPAPGLVLLCGSAARVALGGQTRAEQSRHEETVCGHGVGSMEPRRRRPIPTPSVLRARHCGCPLARCEAGPCHTQRPWPWTTVAGSQRNR